MHWRGQPVRLTILGQPCSLKNSRKIIPNPKNPMRPISVPSDAARKFRKSAQKQMPRLDPLMDCPVSVTIRLFYESQRPDLDPALILDCMEGFVYTNDRRVRELHAYHAIDKDNPRAEIIVAPIEGALFQAAGRAA